MATISSKRYGTGRKHLPDFAAEIKVSAISRTSSLKPWVFTDLWNNIYNDPELILETINESWKNHSLIDQKAAGYYDKILCSQQRSACHLCSSCKSFPTSCLWKVTEGNGSSMYFLTIWKDKAEVSLCSLNIKVDQFKVSKMLQNVAKLGKNSNPHLIPKPSWKL